MVLRLLSVTDLHVKKHEKDEARYECQLSLYASSAGQAALE